MTITRDNCERAYQHLNEAEERYLAAGRAACQTLHDQDLAAAVAARTLWVQAMMDAALDTGLLMADDGDLENLGHALVDCADPDPEPLGWPGRDGDLAALPDGSLWVVRDKQFLSADGTRTLTPGQLRAAGGVLLQRKQRWLLVEEALAGRFPHGQQVEHTHGWQAHVGAAPASNPTGPGLSHLAGTYHPEGLVYLVGDREGWWSAAYLTPLT